MASVEMNRGLVVGSSSSTGSRGSESGKKEQLPFEVSLTPWVYIRRTKRAKETGREGDEEDGEDR